MPEVAPRLPCPVCLGTTMKRTTFGRNASLEIDHCGRCGGVWLDPGEVQRLRTIRPAEVRKGIDRRGLRFRMRCHDCHAAMERAEEACPACGWSNVIDCPACDRPMSTESHAGLRIDVCRDCNGVWFDQHELDAIWEPTFDRALAKRRLSRHSTAAAVGEGAGEVLLQSLFYAPDLLYHGARAAGHAAAASAEAAAHLPGVIGAAPEAAATVFDAVGESAGSVFEVIVEIVGGIFDGF